MNCRAEWGFTKIPRLTIETRDKAEEVTKGNISIEKDLDDDKPRESNEGMDKVPKKKASKGGTKHTKLGSQSDTFSFEFLRTPCTMLAADANYKPKLGGEEIDVKTR